jgi:hypothetical protein
MKSTDRLILLALPVLAVIIGFYVLVLSPKASDAGDLQSQVDELQTSLATSQQEIATGQAARKDFHANYSDLVSLGAAAPAEDDQATLVYDISELGQKNAVRFRSFQVTQTSGSSTDAAAVPPATTTPTTPSTTPPATTPPATTPPATTPPATGTTDTTTTSTTATAPTDATATEATAALLPLGATVGPAGLPLMPYDFKFSGNFFDVADFFKDLDDQVQVTDSPSGPDVNGRLMTIDGFALTADPAKGFPSVQADFSVTTYVVPAEQGVDAGASPTGPGAAPVATAPATTVTSTPAPATAAVTP